MILRGEALALVDDERRRGWSYIVEGQTLRLLRDLATSGVPGDKNRMLDILDGMIHDFSEV